MEKDYKIDLQLFADGGEGADGEGAAAQKPKAYTEDDVAAMKAEWEKESAAKLENAKKEGMTEAERLAKLTEDEKKAEQLKKLLEENESYKNKEQLHQLKSEAQKQLEGEKLPSTFADIVLGKDAEATKVNIKSLKTAFDAEIQKAVEDRLKGKTPKAGGSAESKETDIKEQFKKALKGGF